MLGECAWGGGWSSISGDARFFFMILVLLLLNSGFTSEILVTGLGQCEESSLCGALWFLVSLVKARPRAHFHLCPFCCSVTPREAPLAFQGLTPFLLLSCTQAGAGLVPLAWFWA